MGLVRCPDCGHDVSDLAPACINCGRPIAQPQIRRDAPPEACEVVLEQISHGGIFGDPLWALVAEVKTPTGIEELVTREYRSKNSLAEYQGEQRSYQEARVAITNELLRDGWEPLPSAAGPGGLALPRFRRGVAGGMPVGAGRVPPVGIGELRAESRDERGPAEASPAQGPGPCGKCGGHRVTAHHHRPGNPIWAGGFAVLGSLVLFYVVNAGPSDPASAAGGVLAAGFLFFMALVNVPRPLRKTHVRNECGNNWQMS